ncbi:rhodanese-like domain-containing protein [Paenibacillus tuaregi]|uniref:rhodanese-like domain-containing protein n=1 Tax=Paenibacillus tuaregi TaxID=1816681 RepID=UPI0008398518|nr:rhodanese-like domain-containing protein [Paenibacillus tuaregi]
MLVLIILAAVSALWYIRGIWPVKGLSYIDPDTLRQSDSKGDQKLVDVRDAYDFQKCHLQGAINISIGRLPFVWRKEISSGDSVVILADSLRKSRKAARILRKNGFENLKALRGSLCDNRTS